MGDRDDKRNPQEIVKIPKQIIAECKAIDNVAQKQMENILKICSMSLGLEGPWKIDLQEGVFIKEPEKCSDKNLMK